MKSRELDLYIKKYINGDNTSFDVIYEETKKAVYLSIYEITKNKITIEDLMQDTYMKIIKAINNYKIGTNFYAWCSKIARNTALNWYNKNKKEILIDPIENEYMFDQIQEKRYFLDEVLSILQGDERIIFIYRFVLGLKYRDIEKIIDMPVSSIHYTYNKILKKIKIYLGD